ncbi:hypothetical protein [Butyrivibrio sp. NC2007]|uniref:hypothetical protein n=1 Tax=Butyrivibrio sp. NC2007 TaxID=1280683 RepID=UPI0003B54F7D|nr:hypothetical protein [Butyrivibrio sp. NC2007]
MEYVIAFFGGLFSIGIIFSFMRNDYKLITGSYIKWFPLISFLAIVYCFIRLYGNAIPDGYTVTNLVEVQNADSNDVYYWNLKIDIDKNDSTYDIIGYIDPQSGALKEVDSNGFESFGSDNAFYDSNEEYKVIINKKDVNTTFLQAIQYIGLVNLLIYSLLLISTIWASILIIKHTLFVHE